ncbi:MAG: adenylate/guanylate cyclase domain-containing protein [Firmicutes bacterium]|nr:adenylate/guanylate cyclase domain-containing protein [Bacillota bacterium]
MKIKDVFSGHSLIATGLILVLSLLFFYLPTISNLELKTYDWRLEKYRGSVFNDKTRAISIDQASLDELGAFPWDRKTYADLINSIKQKNPKLLVFDILYQEPKPSDSSFAKAIKEAGFDVVLPFCFGEKSLIESAPVFPVESLRKVAAAEGFIDYIVDSDNTIRKAKLAISYNGRIFPSLDLAAYARYKGVPVDKIVYGESKITVGDVVIKTDPDYAILIDYYIPKKGKTVQSFPSRSFFKFMDPERTPDLTGVVLYVGAGTPGMMDDFPVPAVGKMYGSVIHANIFNTLVRGDYVTEAGQAVNLILILVLALVYGLFLSRMVNVVKLFAVSILIAGIHISLNLFMFKNGFWYNLVSPIAVIFAGTLIVSAIQFFRTRKLFGQFVAKEVVDKMVSSDIHTKMGGVEKEVSILFSDIRGYTTLSEKMKPAEVMNLLNEYHGEMVKIFHRHDGRVFDYQGDAQMVVFGAPIERADHAICACKAAYDMDKALQRLREKWKIESRESFEIGVGICTGIAALGIVGAEGALQYSAIGDTTNVASRLQSQSKILGSSIIISEPTKEAIGDYFEIRSLGFVELKGKSKPMEVFTIVAEKDKKPE